MAPKALDDGNEHRALGLQLGAYGDSMGGTLMGVTFGGEIDQLPIALEFILPALFFVQLLEIGVRKWIGTGYSPAPDDTAKLSRPHIGDAARSDLITAQEEAMLSTPHLTILLAGIATFLQRWLPVMQHSAPRRNLPGSVRQLLAAIGPAALAALLTISLFPCCPIFPSIQRLGIYM